MMASQIDCLPGGFEELMTVLLYDKLMDFLKSGEGSADPSEVEERFKELQGRYQFASCHSGPTRVNISMSFNAQK